MTNPQKKDDALFDRLVDGELSATERQQLLASLDDPQGAWHDQGWRRCALAFLEAQTWGREFKQMVAESGDEHLTVTAVAQPSSSSARTIQWLGIAAALLIAFSLGRLIDTERVADDQIGEMAVVEPETPLPHAGLPDIVSDDAVTLLVRDTDGNNQRVQVPLMEVDDFDSQFGSALPSELRDRFRDQGFDVQRRRRFAPMFFEQDKQLVPMVVPVDDTYVVPVSRPIY